MVKPHGAASEYAARMIRGHTVAITNTLSTAGGVEQVLKPDTERVQFLIVNLSANDVYLGFDANVSATRGILCPANGGMLALNVVDDFELTTMPIYIYSAAAGNNIYSVAVRRETLSEGV